MRYLIFTISFFISNSLLGQITFEPTFINQCSNEVESFQSWYIAHPYKTYIERDFKEKMVTLPDTGVYHFYWNMSSTPIEIIINKKGINRDTFFTKRITLKQFIIPSSEYLECGNPANGKLTDYYFNGKTRMKGIFENGQPIDTLFSYNRSGQLTEIFISNKKGWKKINYFKNGHTKSEETKSKKNKQTLKEYYQNGVLKRTQNHKSLEIYNQDKVAIEKITRKEILIFERLFKKKKHGRDKFYEYKWKSFDNRGIIKREMFFDSDHFEGKPFPDSVRQIDDFLFEKIIFYFNGKEFKKITIEYDMNNNFSKKLVLFRKEGKEWIREKTTTTSKVYKMIDNYSN